MRYFIFLLALFPLLSEAQVYNAVMSANNAFAFDLYYKASSSPDFLLSPVSVSSAMAMLYAGARGETKATIKDVFHFPDNDGTLNQGSLELANILKQRQKNSRLDIANKLWVSQENIKLDSSFVRLNKKYYSAGLQTVNFNNSSTSKIINDWVATQTNDKIKDLLDPDFISSDLDLILINAVYFKSIWKNPFDPLKTVQGKFNTEKNNKVDVSFMTDRQHQYATWKNEYVNMIELPFANDEFSLDILLPVNNMAELEETLTADEYEGWLSNAQKATFTLVKVPKFKSNFKIELSTVLKDMGMGIAFTPGANFDGVGQTDGPIMISKVVHQTFIEVNEEGAEAAASTAIGAVHRSMSIENQFIADHPFIYILRHPKTKTILFIGKISNPSY